MASSKVMTTTSTTNTDLPCQQPPLCPSLSSLLADLQHQHDNPTENETDPSHTATMDDLLKNIYPTPTPDQVALNGDASLSREGSFSIAKEMGNKSVEDVWKEIVAGSAGSDQRPADVEMTLEDFLTKAGAVREEDVKAHTNNNNFNNVNNNHNENNNNNNNNNSGGNQMVMVGGGGGRVKRRVVEEPPLDKASQQKQRRMIKNRESAARSRERKQAYTVELEFLVTQLEEENARLLRDEAEKKEARFKQLVENLIPVVEKRRPPRPLRRVHSLQW